MPDKQEYTSLKLAFEPFAKFEQGTPIRVLPEGTWYRGARKLEVTKERLTEMVKNFAAGLPRFRIPINLDHGANGGGKVGTIKDLQYLPNGPQGSGLYATDYEFEEKGLEAIEENGYDAVSAEVVWTVGGQEDGTYQDPETGGIFDNVLVGLALTPKPFFGHNNVALFCAHDVAMETPLGGAKSFAEYEQYLGESEERYRISNLHSIFRQCFDNIWEDTEVKLVTKLESVAKLGKEFLGKVSGGDEYAEDNLATEEILMADKTKTEETPKAEEFVGVQMSQEDYDALNAKAAKADEQKSELDRMTAEKAEAETVAQETELRELAETYEALPVVIDEFVENMSALDEEEAGWFKAQFAALDKVLVEAGILREDGATNLTKKKIEESENSADAFLQIVDGVIKEEFDGDSSKYAEALLIASKKHPELAKFE